nr:unnamed protein product [Callosobruchus analis]
MKVLSYDSTRPSRLERHLNLERKSFLSSKTESLKRMRLDQSGSYHTTSFEIAFIIAKQKKKHILSVKN